MNRFPLYLDLTDKSVYLVGDGPQIRDKAQKLESFGPRLIWLARFSEEDARQQPALVIAGDLDLSEAEAVYRLCCRYQIPVNVVDQPELCTFFFPALITKGDLTVSLSTGGSCPAAAAWLRRRVEETLPDRTEEILLWLSQNRLRLRQLGILSQATAEAFSRNRPLTEIELQQLQ